MEANAYNASMGERGGRRVLEISIDPDLCIGSGDCTRVAPSAFGLDEDRGVSIVRPDAGHVEAALLLRAARGCPTQAIRVRLAEVEESGGDRRVDTSSPR